MKALLVLQTLKQAIELSHFNNSGVTFGKDTIAEINEAIAELEANAKKEVQTIRKGQVFLTQTHGRVVFEGLDFYGGECTAKLRGVDHRGTFYPKLETLPDFQFIDN